MDIKSEDYIDIQDALKRVGGNKDLYKRLLTQFTGGDYIAPLELALNKGAMEDASHLIHTLKGVSANLSLVKLKTVSAELELLIKNNSEYSDCFTELKKVFDITTQQIAELV
jgi:HPt (histidine-containing phosphotransfer) domain-containing protein